MQFSKSNIIKLLFFCYQFVCVASLIIACNNTPNYQKISSKPNRICVQNYNPNTDYFPDKVSINYAKSFSVKYQNNYKVITVKNPYPDAKTSFKYVLV